MFEGYATYEISSWYGNEWKDSQIRFVRIAGEKPASLVIAGGNRFDMCFDISSHERMKFLDLLEACKYS